MKKLFLHIGFHKTGTSALQYFLWNNRKLLKRYGVLYPEFGCGKGFSHGMLANIIKPNNNDARLDEYREKLYAEIDESDSGKVVISSEVFLESNNVAEAVRGFFKGSQFDVEIVVYVRNQIEWLESVYNEVVRDPYRRFTGQFNELREYKQRFYDYDTLINSWENNFSMKSINLRVYDKLSEQNTLFYDFLDVLKINKYEVFDYKVENKNKNLRFHPLATEFLRRLNRHPMLNDVYFQVLEELARISSYLYDKEKGKYYTVIDEDIKNEILEELYEKNKTMLLKYSGRIDKNIIKNNKIKNKLVNCQSALTPEIQHFIIDNMSPNVKNCLEMTIGCIKKRKLGSPFLLPAPGNIVGRQTEIIMRQRFELRKLYEKINQ